MYVIRAANKGVHNGIMCPSVLSLSSDKYLI